MADPIDYDTLRTLEKLPLPEARKISIDMLKQTKTKPDRLNHLIRDIERSPHSRDVQRIMWNMVLSGNGLSVMNSEWSKMHGAVASK